MKKSQLIKLIKKVIQEQGAMPKRKPSMNTGMKGGMPPGGTSRKISGGNNMCLCADGSQCPQKSSNDGRADCSCCLECDR